MTRTCRERTGCIAGPWRTAPEVTSNWLPWQGQVSLAPSSLPPASEHPRCVQVSSKACIAPSTFATFTFVPATFEDMHPARGYILRATNSDEHHLLR